MGLLNKVWSMLWNAPPERKSTALSAYFPTSTAEWSRWNYATFANEAYCGNPFVYRAARLIAQTIAGLTVYAAQTGTDEKGKKIKAPVGDGHKMQRVLVKPNGYQGWEQFIEEWVAHIILTGEAYILRPETPGEMLTFNLMRPDQVEIVKAKGPDGRDVKHFAAAYRYEQKEYPAEQVGHVYLYNPTDDWRGLSPLLPGSKSVDMNNAGRNYHTALFQNGAVAGAVITSTEGATVAELDALREQISLQKRGAIRAGDTWLLPSTQRFEKASWSPRDSMTPDISIMSLREICVALGIDPALLGDSANKTYSNFKEARAGLYIDSVLPMAGLLLGALSAMLQDWYPGVEYVIDKDQIDELSESQDGLWNRVVQGIQNMLVTPDEGREMIGFERTGQAWAQQFYSAAALLPVGDMSEMGEDEPEAQPVVEPVVVQPVTSAAPMPALAEPASNTALNGAQVTSAVEIVSSVASRALPRDAGVAMLMTFFNLTAEQAEAVMGTVGTTFFAEEAAPPQEDFVLADLDEIERLIGDGDIPGAVKAAGKVSRAARTRALALAQRRGVPILKRIVRQLVEADVAEALERA